MIDKNAENFTLDETIMSLENIAVEAINTRWKNHNIGKIGKIVGLVKGDVKRELDANKLFIQTVNDIVRHLIIDMGVPNIRVFLIYYNNRLYNYLKSMYPLIKKMDEQKMREYILKLNKKGKMNEFTVDDNNEFVITK